MKKPLNKIPIGHEDYTQIIDGKEVGINVPVYEHDGPYITGYYGCKCHPFKSWDECNKLHRQRFKIGDLVMNRCNGKIGAITEINKEHPYFYSATEMGTIHAAEIIPVQNIRLNYYDLIIGNYILIQPS